MAFALNLVASFRGFISYLSNLFPHKLSRDVVIIRLDILGDDGGRFLLGFVDSLDLAEGQ